MKVIAVLTYNQIHRKTYDTLCLLKARGYSDVRVYGQSMTYTKKTYPLIEHRPEQNISIPRPEVLCDNLGFEYIEGSFEKTITDSSIVYLLCGSGLLNQEFVRCHRIINAHPGYIPVSRGLDSYKWSLYYGLPLGVTTHFLGDYIDAGEVIERREIKVKKYDTFHSVAQRIYENEIDMLVGAIELADKKHVFIFPETTNLFKRMPHKLEEGLFEIFDKYKAEHMEREV